jgi:hypothetical protein
MSPPNRYYYVFTADTGSVVRVLRGPDPPKMTGGAGGWQIINRPRRVGITQWTGFEPYQMEVPVFFDGWHAQESVEDDIRRLNQMQLGSDYQPPPTVSIDGALPVVGATWVISTIDWGDIVYWKQMPTGDFVRLRQDAIVHLLQYVAEERLLLRNVGLPHTYTVFRKGVSLRDVAKEMYGSPKRWKDIQKANPKIRDPNNIPTRTTLRIP